MSTKLEAFVVAGRRLLAEHVKTAQTPDQFEFLGDIAHGIAEAISAATAQKQMTQKETLVLLGQQLMAGLNRLVNSNEEVPSTPLPPVAIDPLSLFDSAPSQVPPFDAFDGRPPSAFNPGDSGRDPV